MHERSLANLSPRRDLDVLMDLTPRCNIYCTMCLLPLEEEHSKGAEMPEVVFKRISDEVFPRAKSVSLSCGSEPFMSKRFLPALETAVSAGVPNVRFVTNGLLMTDDAIERIIELGVNRIMVSLDGATAATYESIRVGGKFEKLVDRLMALDRIKKARRSTTPVLKFSWVLMRSNLDEVLGLVELARRVGAGEIYLRHLVPFAELDVSHELVFDTPHTVNAVLDEAWERARGYGIRMTSLPKLSPGRLSVSQKLVLSFEQAREIARDEGLGGVLAVVRRKWRLRTKACDQPWFSVYIRPDGSINPCGAWFKEAPLGSLASQHLQEIYGSEDAQRLRNELTGLAPLRSACAQCPNVVSGRSNQHAFKPRSAWASGRPRDWKPKVPKILERARKSTQPGAPV
jgi:radical SAM protein with 4Fe4S-binding SPASM domain